MQEGVQGSGGWAVTVEQVSPSPEGQEVEFS